MAEEEAFHDAFHPDPLVVGDLQHTAGSELLLPHAHDVSVADLVQALNNGVVDEHPKHYEEMTAGVDVIDATEMPQAKRQKTDVLTQVIPKKLNNEQWDHMFAKLVEYKAEYGVSPQFSGLQETYQ